MALDDDLGQVIAVLRVQQHAQIHRQEVVQQLLTFLFDGILAGLKEHGGRQHDVAGVGIHRRADVVVGQGAGQGLDDLGADAHDAGDAPGLGQEGLPLLLQLGGGGGQSLLLRGQLYLQLVQLGLLLPQNDDLGSQLGLRGLQLSLSHQ